MTVRYHTDHGHPIPDYVCQRRGIQTAEPLCQRLPGAQIDQAVTELVLKAVNPSSLDVALPLKSCVHERLKLIVCGVHKWNVLAKRQN
jgi:hypothetical protein